LTGRGATSDRALRAAVALVALAGTAIAGYLTYVHYRPAALICTGSGGCETVQESSYADLAGIPVALLVANALGMPSRDHLDVVVRP